MVQDALSDESKGPAAVPPCRPWGFWATTGFAVLSVIVWVLFQALGANAAISWLRAEGDNGHVVAFASHGTVMAMATLVSAPAAIAVLLVAVGAARCRAGDYLALRWPPRGDLLPGLGIVVGLLLLGDLSSWLTGRSVVPPFMVDVYESAREAGHLLLLGIALVVAAPLMEEVLFRGFLLPGYAASRLGWAGAIVLTSAAWAVMHLQYEAFFIVQIFILGCVFGWLRWRSGATTLTIILHGFVNLAALLQVAWLTGAG
jgi:membrane protease YdiL (CAAX protease family)